MNIVFLTSESMHQYYVINELHKIHPIRKVFLQRRVVKEVRPADRMKRRLRPSAIAAGIRSVLEKLLFRRERRLEYEFEIRRFFPNRTPELVDSIPFEFVHSFNETDAVARVAEEEPDIIIVFGTEILRGAILNTARIAMLNIHRAIVPLYRGGGHPFWAFYHGDFDHVGTTVHVCVNQLDGGDVLGQGLYSLSSYDRVHMLRYHTTMIALGILRRVIP
ncbi:MAG TPA: formyltransferase family protein, partial [Terriglobia bacterium]|nr:formyltransferase family protein [Terriglobia bacterium]